MSGYALGWNPVRARQARDEMLASRRYCLVADDVEYPKAYSLSRFLLREMRQGQAGTCFPPGTRVRMADGSERKIEEIRPLEEVLTAEGNIGAVMQLFGRRYDGPLVCLKLWGHSHLKMTPEHPVLTKRGYVPAAELQLDDWVAMPRYLPATNSIVQTADHVFATSRTITRDRVVNYNGVRGRKGLSVLAKALPDVIGLTKGAGRIFGLFLAEGSTDSGKVVWTFNLNEEETLVAELVTLLREEWGLDPAIYREEKRHVCRVKIYGSLWARLFESLCSTGSARKALHPDLTSGPREFLEALFQAWKDGDGSAHGRNGKGERGVTISHDLALNMYDIAQAIGLMPGILLSKPTVNRYAKTRQPRWDIGLQSKGENYRVQMDDRHVWRKVRGIDQEDYSGPVFNIGVEGDNSYVTEGIGVHNCWVHAGVCLAETTASALGYEAFPICRRLVGWVGKQLEGGGNPSEGGTCSDSLAAMTQDKGAGIAHEDLCPYSDNSGTLGSRPPQNVWDDAKKAHLVTPIDVRSDDDARKLIAHHYAVSIGTWWAFNFDDHQTFMSSIGNGTYGHALTKIGYVMPGVFPGEEGKHAWFQWRNWHGLLYPPLPPEYAAVVPGYKSDTPDRTSDFWVPDYLDKRLQDMGNYEYVSATDLEGIKRKIVIPSFADAFPI